MIRVTQRILTTQNQDLNPGVHLKVEYALRRIIFDLFNFDQNH